MVNIGLHCGTLEFWTKAIVVHIVVNAQLDDDCSCKAGALDRPHLPQLCSLGCGSFAASFVQAVLEEHYLNDLYILAVLETFKIPQSIAHCPVWSSCSSSRCSLSSDELTSRNSGGKDFSTDTNCLRERMHHSSSVGDTSASVRFWMRSAVVSPYLRSLKEYKQRQPSCLLVGTILDVISREQKGNHRSRTIEFIIGSIAWTQMLLSILLLGFGSN